MISVYDIGRFIVYLSYILFVYFFVGSGVGILVVYLVSVYLVLFCFWEVIDYILGLCTQKYLEFSGL